MSMAALESLAEWFGPNKQCKVLPLYFDPQKPQLKL